MRSALAWVNEHVLSPTGRKAIYALLAAVSALLIGLGVIDNDTATAWDGTFQQVLAVLASVVAILNVSGAEVDVEPEVEDAVENDEV